MRDSQDKKAGPPTRTLGKKKECFSYEKHSFLLNANCNNKLDTPW